MKRFLTSISPIAFLALLVVGAAPANKKSVDAPAPTVEANAPSQLDLQITEPSATTPSTTPEAAAVNATYSIDWYSINGGGTTNASSPNYKMGASIGQSVAGAASSASYNMGIGFWYGASGSASCACDCHNDPVCDGIFSNVQDVVATINVAFRGGAVLTDPNANCPYQQSDVNCDTFTSIIDVVRVVNVAFRGANPATEYCNACP